MSVDAQFAALADATRCRVVELLHEKPRPVHDLAAAFSISRPAISRHLRVLKEAGLVKEEKRGRENVYSLQRQRLRPPSDWLTRHLGSRPPAPEAAPGKTPTKAPRKPAAAAREVAPKELPPPPQMQLDLF